VTDEKKTGAQRPIAMLLSDVDGTLVTRKKELTPRAIAAVRALGDAGIRFAITSSRPPAGLMHLIEPLGLTTPLAGFNGGLIVDKHDRELRKFPLGRDEARQAVEELDRRRIDIWVFHGNEWLVTNPDGAYVAHEQMTIRYAPRIVPDFSPYLGGVTKIVGSGTNPGLLIEASLTLQDMLGERASIALSQPYYLDITDTLANKGTAVLVNAEMLGISPDSIATIGDMENDVRMFEKSGFSIAMGNASPAVQARADVVTASNEEDGFALAVERFILPRAPG
jgi:Cof subfamily protein (haloacid dehalogenase superfamily)